MGLTRRSGQELFEVLGKSREAAVPAQGSGSAPGSGAGAGTGSGTSLGAGTGTGAGAGPGAETGAGARAFASGQGAQATPAVVPPALRAATASPVSRDEPGADGPSRKDFQGGTPPSSPPGSGRVPTVRIPVTPSRGEPVIPKGSFIPVPVRRSDSSILAGTTVPAGAATGMATATATAVALATAPPTGSTPSSLATGKAAIVVPQRSRWEDTPILVIDDRSPVETGPVPAPPASVLDPVAASDGAAKPFHARTMVLRYDTLGVAGFFALVLHVLSFLFGRSTVSSGEKPAGEESSKGGSGGAPADRGSASLGLAPIDEAEVRAAEAAARDALAALAEVPPLSSGAGAGSGSAEPAAAEVAGGYAITAITTNEAGANEVQAFLAAKGFRAYVVRSGRHFVVRIGGYESASSPEAKRDLDALKRLVYKDGTRPFQGAW